VIWQNLALAMSVIVVLVASALGFSLPLTLGVVGHEGSTVLVCLNGLRLLAFRAIEGQKWTNRAKLSFIRGPSLVRMKKIEAIIDPAALEAVKLHLAEAGIDGRLTITEVSGLEDLGRFYQMETTGQKPRLRIDLIVSDRQTQSTVNIILQHANLAGQPGTGGHINILSLDATLEINAEALCQPSKEKKEPLGRGHVQAP
jgi:nitrogen regulatory protein PII